MKESTLNKVSTLLFSEPIRYSLGQPENVIDVQAFMDDGISVIYDLGGLEREEKTFIGAILAVAYEKAAESRQRVPVHLRRDHQLIIDEFPPIAETSATAFSHMLSETRKQRLFLTLAHQQWGQVGHDLKAALGNTMRIAFRLDRDDALWLAPRLTRYDAGAIKQAELNPEKTQTAFVSVLEQHERMADEIITMPGRTAYLQYGRDVRRFRTIDVPTGRTSPEALQRVKDHYAQRLQTRHDDVVAIGSRHATDESGDPGAGNQLTLMLT